MCSKSNGSAFRLLVLSLFLALTLMPCEARADYATDVAVLQCDASNNCMLVWFGALPDESPGAGAIIDANDPMLELVAIPDNFSTWSAGIEMHNEGTCVLADGHKILVETTDGALRGGPGGLDPDTFFRLRPGGRYIYDRMLFYSGHSSSTFDLGAVAYENGALIECDPHEDTDYGRTEVKSDPKCRDISDRLRSESTSFTPDEKAELAKDAERSRLASALSSFCRDLSPPKFFLLKSDEEDDVDVNNDGKVDRVFFFTNGGNYTYDNCGYLVSFTDSLPRADAFAKKFLDQVSPDQELVEAASAKEGGHIIRLATENMVISVNSTSTPTSPFPTSCHPRPLPRSCQTIHSNRSVLFHDHQGLGADVFGLGTWDKAISKRWPDASTYLSPCSATQSLN